LFFEGTGQGTGQISEASSLAFLELLVHMILKDNRPTTSTFGHGL
jgi:hypothetical protein